MAATAEAPTLGEGVYTFSKRFESCVPLTRASLGGSFDTGRKPILFYLPTT
jgi:hypothetical protein